MDSQWEAIFQYGCTAPDHPYLPNLSKSVHILGKTFDAKEDRESIEKYLKSKLWMTYRKDFSPIGDANGPKSDAGWGCMHRCGQMMLAEAISQIHLGQEWVWSSLPTSNKPDYFKLLRMFQDRKSALYSIQNMTLTGVSVGKPVASWLGPNTVAQIIKKLSVHDQWTKLIVHIAVEDGVIVDEIKLLCKHTKHNTKPIDQIGTDDTGSVINNTKFSVDREMQNGDGDLDDISDTEYNSPFVQIVRNSDQSICNDDTVKEVIQTNDTEINDIQSLVQFPVIRELDDDCVEIIHPPTFTTTSNNSTVDDTDPSMTMSNGEDPIGTEFCTASTAVAIDSTDTSIRDKTSTESPHWRPLLLFVSIRLGVHNPNPCMFDAVKSVFHLSQCIGILGGRPSHAVWIVGYVGDDVICLDPHSTQPAFRNVTITPELDNQFHCNHPIRIPLSKLDPSMVIGFLCHTEIEFDQLCVKLQTSVLYSNKSGQKYLPLIEVHPTRLSTLPPLPTNQQQCCSMLNSPTATGNNCDKCSPLLLDEATTEDHESSSPSDDGDKLTNAVNGVRKLLSKYQQLAGDTVRSLWYDAPQPMDEDENVKTV